MTEQETEGERERRAGARAARAQSAEPEQTRLGEEIARLALTIATRKGGDPNTSWTAQLFALGPEACARKFGEEALEAMIEALRESQNPKRLASEAADVLYHLLVMCAARGVSLAAIEAELARRAGTSGLAEKASRSKKQAAHPKG